MSWTAPLTWVGNQLLTSTHMNTYIRDNMLEQAPPLATEGSSYFVGDGPNSLVERKVVSARSSLSASRASSAYGDCTGGGADVGPAVTATHDVHCIIILACKTAQTVTNAACVMSWAASGANTIAASDNWCLLHEGMFASNDMTGCSIYRTNALTPGTTTFTAKYRCGASGGTAFFDSRMISVWPL